MSAKPVSKIWHVLLTLFGAGYLTFVFLSKPFINAAVSPGPQSVWVYLLCAVAFFCLCCGLLHVLAVRRTIVFHHSPTRAQLSPAFFAIAAICVFLLYFAYLIAWQPGGFSPDTAMQWHQAHTMEFDDHHPFFHTFLFVVLTRILDNYTFMLLCQIFFFACGMAYLAATMRAWGFRLSVIIVICAVMALASPTRNIVLYFWKDTAMSVFFLYLLSHIFNIMLTDGLWLKKPLNLISTAVLLACITLVRHNAILLTAPFLVLLLIQFASVRRSCIKLIALVLVIVIGVKGPLYHFFNVNSTSDSYLETTGLPMTILFSSYVYSPETMPPEAYAFLETLEDHETACERYKLGNYNSIKWNWDMSYSEAQKKMEAMPIADFLNLTLETIRGNKMLAAYSVVKLTDMVWDPVGAQINLVDPPKGDPPSRSLLFESMQEHVFSFFQTLDVVFASNAFQRLASQLGILILIMLFACYISIHRMHFWRSLWVVLPVMCYNFGTMLLLCGPDYRFFHFNCLAAYPLAVLLLSQARQTQSKPCK